VKPSSFFHHCPSCGARLKQTIGNPLVCPACGFTYYFNPALAVAGILLDPANRVLLTRRAHEPAQGKLALPGGFVESGEAAEVALSREIQEEVGLKVTGFDYLCSRPNEYPYRGVTYPVLDLFFTARVPTSGEAVARDEIAGIEWVSLEVIDLEQIAFRSIREALQVLSRKNAAGEAG